MGNSTDTKEGKISQANLIIEFFKKHPNRDISHPEVVDWVEMEYLKITGNKFRDPDRGIRKLHQEGWLVKISDGIYRYDPSLIKRRNLQDFTPTMKQKIFKRDGFRCVICGRGPKEGYKLYADHIKAKDLGGAATIENGETLCGPHNFFKKNYSQTEIGKKMFILFYKRAKILSDKQMLKFCTEILEVYKKNDIDSHIKWIK